MENQAFKMTSTKMKTDHTEYEREVDLVDLFYVIWGHFWQILVFLVLGAVVALGITKFLITPLYEATSSIYIVSASNNSVVNLTDLQIGAQLTADYQELMLSRPLLEDVIDNLELKNANGDEAMSVKELREMIEVTNASDTRILKLTVTSPDPQESADIANELVNQACIYLPQIMETEEPNLVEEAIAPTEKSSPSYIMNTLIGGFVAACVCCAVLILRYLLNDTFMTPDDVAKVFGVQPLATIPEAETGEYGHGHKMKYENNRKEAK